MKKHQIFSALVTFSWALLLCLGAYFYFQQDISIESVVFWAKSYVLENPFIGIALFILLYVIRPLFFVIVTPFDIFSWMVFGPVYGFLLSSIATFFSTMFSYWVWRGTWGQFIQIKQWKKLERLKNKLHKDTLFTTMMMRFLILPFDLTNYICGVLKAPFWKYVAGTTSGVIPVTFLMVSAGSAFYGKNVTSYDSLLENIKYENLWFASGFFITILVVSKLLKKKYKNINL